MKRFILVFVLLAVSAGAQAAERQSKDWAWGVGDAGSIYAATTNSAGNFLGQYCYPSSGGCYYVIKLNTRCEAGADYPALINAASGAVHASLRCTDKGGMVFKDFDQIDSIVRTAPRIGVVVPMEDGAFTVSRFSLAGSTNAIDRMRVAAEAKYTPPEDSSQTAEIRI